MLLSCVDVAAALACVASVPAAAAIASPHADAAIAGLACAIVVPPPAPQRASQSVPPPAPAAASQRMVNSTSICSVGDSG